VRRIAEMALDPTPDEMAAFNTVRAEITARIRSLEAQLATASAALLHSPRLRALHERLSQTEVAALVDGFGAYLQQLSREDRGAAGAGLERRSLLARC
jgi:hypothetical protein